jgi:hypothetical protein
MPGAACSSVTGDVGRMPEHAGGPMHSTGGLATSPDGPVSPLELLHPDGVVRNCHAFGQACPPRLMPAINDDREAMADLVVIAPTNAECRRTDVLPAMVDAVATRLARDGLVYGLVPPRWRSRVQRLMLDRGLATDLAILHLPTWAASRYLIPFQLEPASYAFSRLIAARAWKGNLGCVVLRYPAVRRLLGHLLPSAAFVARRPGARPLMNWIGNLDGDMAEPGATLLSASWRGRDGSIVVHRLPDDRQPGEVVKLNWRTGGAARHGAEPAHVATFGAAAEAAGARVPTSLRHTTLGSYSLVRQRLILGRSLAVLLAERRERAAGLMHMVAAWLQSWNLSTADYRTLDRAYIAQNIVSPAAELADVLACADPYGRWLATRCTAVYGPVPVVAAHRDLTTWNLLVDETGRLGVLDWAEACGQSLPLGDFVYAMTDIALHAGMGRADRVRAFQACFAPGGRYQPIVLRYLRQQRDILRLSPEIVELCVHATFLGHARNEYRQGGSRQQGSFRQLVEWLAANRTVVRQWLATESG